MNLDENIAVASKAVKEADAVLITAGAGMGVDSGLPDFRGNEGFWKAYPPIAKMGISFSEMANPLWFEKNPKLAWAFYGHRLNLYRSTIPHDGFRQLIYLVNSKKGKYFVYTSNVDGQFQKAGFDSDRIVECHGSIHYFQCKSNCTTQIWSAENEIVSVNDSKFEAQDPLPVCYNCKGLARPNILMFGDWGWNGNRTENQERKLSRWLIQCEVQKLKLVVIEIGAGSAVPTVRMKSQKISRNFNATLIRINPRDFNVPQNGIPIQLHALDGISRILNG